MRRLLPVVVLALLVPSPVSAAPAPTRAPDAVAWWSATPALPGVLPPDVGPRDLYVAGSNLVPLALPGFGPIGPLAVAGLRFQLPTATTATQLTLRLAGVRPAAVSIAACRALRPFAQVYGGAWADLPPYDCTGAAPARFTPAGDVVFDGIDGLRRGRALDILLVPGPLDRVVVATAGLGVATAPSSTTPPVAAPEPAGPVPTPVVPSPAQVAGPVLQGPFGPGPRPAGTVPPAAVPPALACSSATAADARPWPALLLTLLVSVAVFGALLRPPSPGSAGGVHGVGRLRRERSGRVPDLV